jgi:hypothetical protein
VRTPPSAHGVRPGGDLFEHIAEVLPDAWLAPAATGSPEQCAKTVAARLDLGVDGVTMHCSAPGERWRATSILLDHHVARHHADIEAVDTHEGTDLRAILIVGRVVSGRAGRGVNGGG